MNKTIESFNENAGKVVEPNSLRSQFSRLVRETIIEKAMERFREDGYRAATVKSIAKAAHTTHTTFYKFFDGKFEVLLAASATVRPEMDATVTRLRAIDPTDWVNLRRWVDEYAALWDQRQAIFEAIWVAVYGEPKVGYKVIDETMHMASVYRAGVENAESVSGEPLTRELALIMMTTHPMFSSVMRAQSKKLRTEMLDAVTHILSRALDRPGGWEMRPEEASKPRSPPKPPSK